MIEKSIGLIELSSVAAGFQAAGYRVLVVTKAQVDEGSTRWARNFYDADWTDPALYDMVLNLEWMSVDAAVDLVVAATLMAFCDPALFLVVAVVGLGGSWHGAFTYYFCKELRACRNDLSRAALLKKVRADLKAGHYSQIPQLECEATVRSRNIS